MMMNIENANKNPNKKCVQCGLARNVRLQVANFTAKPLIYWKFSRRSSDQVSHNKSISLALRLITNSLRNKNAEKQSLLPVGILFDLNRAFDCSTTIYARNSNDTDFVRRL